MPGGKLEKRGVAAACLLLTVALAVFCLAAGKAAAQEDAVSLIRRAVNLTREGKLDEAIAVQKRVIPAVAEMAGNRHPLYLMQIALLGDLHIMKQDYAEAERLHRDALRLREEILGPDHVDVASSLAKLADIDITTARYDLAENNLQRVLAIRRKALPESDPDFGFSYILLGRLNQAQSRFADAERSFGEALRLFERHLAPDHTYMPLAQNNLAEAGRALGHYQAAERLLRAALAANERIYGGDSYFIGPNLNNLAELFREQGRFGEAEDFARRAVAAVEKTLGPDHPTIATNLNNLGLLLTVRGRAGEAVSLMRRALDIQRKTFGGQHPLVATALHNLAETLARSGKPGEAEGLYRQALAMREAVGGAGDLSVAASLHSMATFMHDRARFEEAEAFARRAMEIRLQKLPADHPRVADSLANLATMLDELGRHAEARPLYERALAISQKSLGENHPDFAIGLTNLAGNFADTKDWQGAYARFKQGNRIWTERRAALLAEAASAQGGEPDTELRLNTSSFLNQVRAGFELWQAAPAPRPRAVLEESFAAHQWASLTSAASAIDKMSARIAAGPGPLSGLVREQQDLSAQLAALDRSLVASLSGSAAARHRQGELDLQARAEAARRRLQDIAAELANRFPEFAALASPQPVSIAEVKKALKPQEALYTIAMTRHGSFAWVITQDAERWVRIDRTASQIGIEVAALRCGLDAAAWDAEGPCPTLTGHAFTEADAAAGALPPFDVARARALYQTLFGPVEDQIRGRQLIVVPTGPLTQLPFHVLVASDSTAAAGASDVYRQADWLVRRAPITVLPAISSLVALRRGSARGAATEAYLGFGNPLLDGPDPRYAERARQARASERCQPASGPRAIRLADAVSRAAAPMLTTGGLADVGVLRMQSPLPETADELCAVAGTLGAGGDAVHLGRAATEDAVKSMNEAGGLARYRLLHFATHGALAGEAVGVSEPGLLLTPPAKASEADDGYLSASEIGALSLSADLVILSACNTAAGGLGDADTLAGLARSFFYAGARSLLVSHWAVYSDATVKLMTAALAAKARDTRVSYAEALRQSMVALIDKGAATEAHPASWAPFVVVGVAP